jgi:hypothetical protein
MNSSLLYMNSVMMIRIAPSSPRPMMTFCTRANTLTPNTTKKKAITLATVAMTNVPQL